MPHFICRWPCGDVLLASVDSREDLDAILQERSEPGVCKVARYHGPLVLELKPMVPLVFRGSAAAFKLDPPQPAFAPVWATRAAEGDVRVVAADGSSEPAHRVVLRCRMPALAKADWGAHLDEVRIDALPDGPTLAAFLEFLYKDDLPPERLTHALHVAALRCHLPRLAAACERRFAEQLEQQMAQWPRLPPTQQAAALDSLLEWAHYAEALSRERLLELCVHLAAQQLAAARTRPCWQQLSPRTQRLVELAAVATSPPLVHRSLEADGGAGAGAGQQLAAMSIEAESYAQAGGRMTQAEWQALNKYRAAVAEAQTCPQASPLSIAPADLRTCGLAAHDQQRFPFEVKAPSLAPFKRLMDSVCRFAFPSVHGALAALRGERERVAAAAAAASAPGDPSVPASEGLSSCDAADTPDSVDDAYVGATEGISFCASAIAQPGVRTHVPASLRGVGSASDGSTDEAHGVRPAVLAVAARLQRESGAWGSSDFSHSTALPAAALGGSGAEVGAAALPVDEGAADEEEQVSPESGHARLIAAAAVAAMAADGSSEAGAGPGTLAEASTEAPPPSAANHQQHQHQHAVATTAAAARGGRPQRRRRLLSSLPDGGASLLASAGAAAVGQGHPAVAPSGAATDGRPVPGDAVAAAAAASAAAAARREAAAAAAVAGRPALLQLQRALVDDFVLYDDSSAARLHLVGQVVAVERGDAGAAARLLAPANADLFAYISSGSRAGAGQRACSALPGFLRAGAGITSAAVVPARAGSGPHQHTFTPEALSAAQQGSVVVRQANPPPGELEAMLQLLQAPNGGAAPHRQQPALLATVTAAAPQQQQQQQQHQQQQSPASAPRSGRRSAQPPGGQGPSPAHHQHLQQLRRSPRLMAAATGGGSGGAPAAEDPASSSAGVPGNGADGSAQQQQQQQQQQPAQRSRPAPLRLSRLLDGSGPGGMPVPLFTTASALPQDEPPAAVTQPLPAHEALPLPRLLPQMPLPTEQQLSAQVLAAPLAQGAGQPQHTLLGGASPLAQPRSGPAGALGFGSILAAISGGAAGMGLPPGVHAHHQGMGPPGSLAAVGTGAGTAAPRPGGGAPALLAGGLLSEGGVGEWADCETAEFEASLRRITCHGLMELCAALAQPPAPPHMPNVGDGSLGQVGGGSGATPADATASMAGAAAAGPGAAVGGGGVGAPCGEAGLEECAAEEERTPRVGGGGCMAASGPPRAGALTGQKRRLSGT